MPAKRPVTPRPRDQLVARDASSDEGKERMLDELSRVAADVGRRVGTLEQSLTKAPTVTGSRASGAALASLLTVLADLGFITDGTTP